VAWSWILAPTWSPLVHHPITGSHYLKHSLLHPNRAPSPRKQMPPCLVGQNRAPAALFCILVPTPPPLTHCLIAPPHHLKPSLCLPNGIPSTRKRIPPHCVGQNHNRTNSLLCVVCQVHKNTRIKMTPHTIQALHCKPMFICFDEFVV
jgi:hypothetical protein